MPACLTARSTVLNSSLNYWNPISAGDFIPGWRVSGFKDPMARPLIPGIIRLTARNSRLTKKVLEAITGFSTFVNHLVKSYG
jgi:hypothetical protein